MDGLGVEAISANYQVVVERIEDAARSVERSLKGIKLVVVTKGQPVESIHAAIQTGLRIFGENYVQEGVNKISQCTYQPDIEWHMIGHIQSRKAKDVCENFAWVQSLDSSKLAARLDRFAGERDQTLPTLIEFNVSGEESKFGFQAWNESKWEDLLPDIGYILQLKNLDILGLMTMPPYLEDPEKVRPFFQRLNRLRDYLTRIFPEANFRELSMGMSNDYEIAVEENATILRIGTAIMGARMCALP